MRLTEIRDPHHDVVIRNRDSAFFITIFKYEVIRTKWKRRWREVSREKINNSTKPVNNK